jgi:hypothetical protein
MGIPSEIYPFSTQDGKAIPLDIIKPAFLIKKSFSTTSSSFTIAEGMRVATVMATAGCLLRFEEDIPVLVDGIAYASTALIPPNTIVTIALKSGLAYVQSLTSEAGTLYIQVIEKWAGLALDNQYIRK